MQQHPVSATDTNIADTRAIPRTRTTIMARRSILATECLVVDLPVRIQRFANSSHENACTIATAFVMHAMRPWPMQKASRRSALLWKRSDFGCSESKQPWIATSLALQPVRSTHLC